jgi:hypothetical protein
LNHIPVSWNCNIYQHTCSLFIIAYYNVWIIIIIIIYNSVDYVVFMVLAGIKRKSPSVT